MAQLRLGICLLLRQPIGCGQGAGPCGTVTAVMAHQCVNGDGVQRGRGGRAFLREGGLVSFGQLASVFSIPESGNLGPTSSSDSLTGDES